MLKRDNCYLVAIYTHKRPRCQCCVHHHLRYLQAAVGQMLKMANCYLVATYIHTHTTCFTSSFHSAPHEHSWIQFLEIGHVNQITPQHCISIESIIKMTTIWNPSNVMLQYVCGIGILYIYVFIIIYILYTYVHLNLHTSHEGCGIWITCCAPRSLSCLVRGSCGLTSKITKGSNLFKFQRNTLTKLHLVNRRAGEGHLTHFFVCN